MLKKSWGRVIPTDIRFSEGSRLRLPLRLSIRPVAHTRRALWNARAPSEPSDQRLPQHTLVLWPSTWPPSVQPPSTHAFAAPDRYTARHPQLDTPVATRSSAHHAARPATKAQPATKARHVTQLGPSPKHSTPFSFRLATQSSARHQPSARSHLSATRAPPPPTLGSMWMLFVKALWLLPQTRKATCKSRAEAGRDSESGTGAACRVLRKWPAGTPSA